jgi:hypothetical protein
MDTYFMESELYPEYPRVQYVGILRWGDKSIYVTILDLDRPCDLVVRVNGYRSCCPGFDSRRYQIF